MIKWFESIRFKFHTLVAKTLYGVPLDPDESYEEYAEKLLRYYNRINLYAQYPISKFYIKTDLGEPDEESVP